MRPLHRPRPRPDRRWLRLGLGAALASVLYACTPVPVVTHSDSPDTAVDAVALTRDGSDQFAVDRHGAGATVTAPATNTGENTRALFFPSRGASTTDGVACATWVSESTWLIQEGVALRISTDGGRTRAITVTKNVFVGATWVFNVHVCGHRLLDAAHAGRQRRPRRGALTQRLAAAAPVAAVRPVQRWGGPAQGVARRRGRAGLE